MRFPTYFKRQIGAASSDPLLGSDAKPTVATRSLKNLTNEVSHKLSRPTQRIAIGYWYEGGGAGADLPVTVHVYDEKSERWYQTGSGTLKSGEITYVKMSVLDDPPQTATNILQPQHGFDALIVVADNTGATGVYHFVAGPDAAQF